MSKIKRLSSRILCFWFHCQMGWDTKAAGLLGKQCSCQWKCETNTAEGAPYGCPSRNPLDNVNFFFLMVIRQLNLRRLESCQNLGLPQHKSLVWKHATKLHITLPSKRSHTRWETLCADGRMALWHPAEVQGAECLVFRPHVPHAMPCSFSMQPAPSFRLLCPCWHHRWKIPYFVGPSWKLKKPLIPPMVKRLLLQAKVRLGEEEKKNKLWCSEQMRHLQCWTTHLAWLLRRRKKFHTITAVWCFLHWYALAWKILSTILK